MTTPHGVRLEAPRKPLFEKAVEGLAAAFGGGIGWMADHGVLFVGFFIAWIGVGAAILFSPIVLNDVWVSIGSLPIVLQLVVWLLILPVMAGLWVWQTAWPDLVKIALEIGLAGFTLLVMKPKGLFGGTAD